MFVLRVCLIAMAIATQYANACLAESPREGARHLTFDKHDNFTPFKSQPAYELMTRDEFETYRQALTKFNCEAANRVLNKAFVRKYPVFKDAQLGPHCPRAPICRNWTHYANMNFHEYGYCTTIRDLRAVEREIRRQGIPRPKFKLKDWRSETVYANRWIRKRDSNLAFLIDFAEEGYKPALLKLSVLVTHGDTFNAGQEVEYYILKLACLVSDGCQDLADRLEQLRMHIGIERAHAIDKRASASGKDRPRLGLLLQGERP